MTADTITESAVSKIMTEIDHAVWELNTLRLEIRHSTITPEDAAAQANAIIERVKQAIA